MDAGSFSTHDVGFPGQDHPLVLASIFRLRPDGSKLKSCTTVAGAIRVVNLGGSKVMNLTHTPNSDENCPSWGVKPLGRH
jgi:hypothetical protein